MAGSAKKQIHGRGERRRIPANNVGPSHKRRLKKIRFMRMTQPFTPSRHKPAVAWSVQPRQDGFTKRNMLMFSAKPSGGVWGRSLRNAQGDRELVMRYRYVAGLVVTIPVWTVVGRMAVATIRKRRGTEQCKRCGMRKVRPSWPRGMVERLSERFGLIAYRCDGCLHRFYGWR